MDILREWQCGILFFVFLHTFLSSLGVIVYNLGIDNPVKKPVMRLVSSSKLIKMFSSYVLIPTSLLMWGVFLLSLYETIAITISPLSLSLNKRDGWEIVVLVGSFYTGLLSLVMRKMYTLLYRNYDNVVKMEEEANLKSLTDWTPPSQSFFQNLLAPYRGIISPEFHGLENVSKDNQKVLFVSNHALAGMEMPLFIEGVYSGTGVFPRGLSDHFHFLVPFWGEVLKYVGAVDGTREICSGLMEHGSPILVYPGGGHEVLKKKTDRRYGLLWKKRAGFARLAIKHGYTIIPCCSVGTEDMIDVFADLPVGWLRPGLSVPILKPINPSKIQKVYFWFGEPIETGHLKEQWADEAVVWDIREKTREAVEGGIQNMLKIQKNDPHRQLRDRLFRNFHKSQKEIIATIPEAMEKVYQEEGEKEEEN